MFNPLGNSYEWSIFNKNGQMSMLVQRAVTEGRRVSFKDMPVAHSRLRNRDRSPILNKIEDYIENGHIVMIYAAKPNLRIPVFLPFILMQGGSIPTGIVFLDLCGAKIGDNDEVILDDRKLKVSLESCYAAIQFVLLQNSKRLENVNFLRNSAMVFSGIVSECINRKHSIKLSTEVYNPIIYVLNRFCIKTIMGSTAKEEAIETYCLYNILHADIVGIRKIADAFEESDYANISTLLQKMASVPELKSRIGKLTVSGFIENYINMYDSSMLLALEVYSYLFYNILSVKECTYINNYPVLKSIIGKNADDIYAYIIVNICESGS